jgi:hypothetical protein
LNFRGTNLLHSVFSLLLKSTQFGFSTNDNSIFQNPGRASSSQPTLGSWALFKRGFCYDYY